jgi:hypothetical protein
MITLFYQTPSPTFKIPNAIPCHLRNEDENNFKSVKPTFIAEISNYLSIPVNRVTKNTWKGEIAYYHIELEWIDQAMIYQNVFACIDDDILQIIKNPDSNLRLLLWFPNEGFSLSYPRFIDIIDFCIKDLVIPQEKVYFVFGDINIKKNYDKVKQEKGYCSINVYGFDCFEATYHNECRMLESQGYKNIFPREENRVRNLNKFRSKRFIFRNANPREHRLYFAAELKLRNLLNKSYYSWLNRYYIPSHDLFKWIIKKFSNNKDRYESLYKSMTEFMAGAPYILDYTADNIGDELHQRILIPEHFADSYFTFVTETTFVNTPEENVLFLTEKIYQPILQYHPFIVAACPGTLAYMRKYGYETFPELFDESYDEEQDLKKRTAIILENIERVVNMPVDELHRIYYSDNFQKKLIKNKEIFIKNKGRKKWEEAIAWLESFK